MTVAAAVLMFLITVHYKHILYVESESWQNCFCTSHSDMLVVDISMLCCSSHETLATTIQFVLTNVLIVISISDRCCYLCCKQRAEVVVCWTSVPSLTGWCGVMFNSLGQGEGARAAGSPLATVFNFNTLRCGGQGGIWGVILHSGGCSGSWCSMQ